MLKESFPSAGKCMKLIGKKVHLPELLSCPHEDGLMAGKTKKNKKKLQTQPRLSNFEIDPILAEIQHKERVLQLTRSQAFDISGLKNEDEQFLGRRRSSSASIVKQNATFQKQFKDINEMVIDSFKCALHKEVPYHGKMYVSDNYICFYSSILKETKLVVPVTAVISLKKQNTALLVPNALSIKTTVGEKHLFGSLRSREVTFKVLKNVCTHLENGSPTNSPRISIAENSFSTDSKNSQELTHSSFEQNIQDLNTKDCFDTFAEPVSSTDAADGIRNGIPLCKENKEQGDQPEDGPSSCYIGDSCFQKVTKKMKSFVVFHESATFNILIIIYVLLVLLLLISSGYIGFRIVALEEQLMSMGAWPELHTHNKYRKT
ncbi:GRAM domain-containing protein 2B isoform X2 [Scyliorhinus canicula]|uniref:GRAM domain-containing protein 2B isoform X2 n=1 Tax=Scyliorhinus canicula TaxID=7830 RepID=UPI0018F4E26C|nr:GRAM domain-containing protein 2B isoform X2 [Scyliorhinus canicula]